MEEQIHIGQIIQEELKRQGKTVTWLSQQLNISRTECYRIFHRKSTDTQTLYCISVLLGRDFFEEYTKYLTEMGVE